MLDAVYVDLLNNRSIVGILPKPASYRLFGILKQTPDSKVIICNPKANAPDSAERMVGLVETGESRIHPRIRDLANLMPELLEQLIAVGEMAKQIRYALGNWHWS
jgi:hypothetical protein